MNTIIVPGTATLIEAANQAISSHLHLVIDHRGRTLLTPILLPGMQRIGVRIKERKAA